MKMTLVRNSEMEERRQHLHALVDMGSNGIRFSISDLSPPTARILPTVHVHRSGLSLYDAQFDSKGRRIPIPHSVSRAVIASLARFKIICSDFKVPENQIRIIATEATREALNAKEFIAAVKAQTGLIVEVLPKEEEGKIGAMGIASSFTYVSGLVMDLGGGSTQISWMISREGQVQTSPTGAFSFPYGAAALTRLLDDLKNGKSKDEYEKALAKLREDMKKQFLDAYHNLEIPQELIDIARLYGGFQLYLCGGGFRGWGYLLLYQSQVHGHHYPISIINGYKADKVHFERTEEVKKIARTANKIFRISDRRRAQVPAVAFLVNVLSSAIPFGIKEAQFCQGGVREGVLFEELHQSVRRQHPLQVATERFARPASGDMADLFLSTIPPSTDSEPRSFPRSISADIVRSLANVFFEYSDVSKEISSAAALGSTTTGLLASAHGVSHTDRALLALMFEERFEGELPPREADYKASLRALLTTEQVWWTRYIGKVAMIMARIYPAGTMEAGKPRVKTSARWIAGLGKNKNKDGIELKFSIPRVPNDPYLLKETMEDLLRVIEKVGKRKNWIGGKEGWGIKVKAVVKEEWDQDPEQNDQDGEEWQNDVEIQDDEDVDFSFV